MYILSLHGKEGEGAYAVTNDDGHKALYLFEQEDDATRYAGLLEANEALPLTVVQIDDTPVSYTHLTLPTKRIV